MLIRKGDTLAVSLLIANVAFICLLAAKGAVTPPPMAFDAVQAYLTPSPLPPMVQNAIHTASVQPSPVAASTVPRDMTGAPDVRFSVYGLIQSPPISQSHQSLATPLPTPIATPTLTPTPTIKPSPTLTPTPIAKPSATPTPAHHPHGSNGWTGSKHRK